jgi:hypothetical protein
MATIENRVKKTCNYFGPLFIIGMPRSGTKLLRDLLNQHPLIGIPISESHFIPYMVRQFGSEGINSVEILRSFYNQFTQTAFFVNMRELGFSLNFYEFNLLLDNDFSWQSIFQVILQYYAPPGQPDKFIWGDKTPGYVNHIQLLRKLYPQSKFIQILRDPRDYALSVQNAWRKNIYRAADTWQATIKDARNIGQSLNDGYLEIFYENLLDHPEIIMRSISAYLGIEYNPAMLTLDHPSENLGDTQNSTTIVQENKEKYKRRFSQKEIQRIEEIVFPELQRLPYFPDYAARPKPLGKFEKYLYKMQDAISVVLFHIKEKGLSKGLKYFYQLHQKSSWR